MRQKLFIFILTTIFLLSQVTPVDAKGFSRSRGFGGGSFSKSSKGYFGSTRSKSSGGSFFGGFGSSKKSSGGYSGSSSKSSSGSGSSRGLFGSYSSKGSTKSGSKSSTLKSSYMKDTYAKQASKSNFKKYSQNLNTDQKKAYDASMNTSYKVKNRMNFEDAIRTRTQRASYFNSRPIYVNVNRSVFGSPLYYGSAFAGPWDLWFLMRASDLFWFHHWNEINPYRNYFDQAQFSQLETRVKNLEKTTTRDPSYMEPGVDPDLQFSDEYQQKHLDNVYYTDKYSNTASNPAAVLIVIIIIGSALFIIVRKVSRPRARRTFNSRIY